jgi:hypothetical protein
MTDTYKLIVAGSRECTNFDVVAQAYQSFRSLHDWRIDFAARGIEIVSGGARGVDALGETIAEGEGHGLKRFPADWDKHGKAAGFIRNREMAEYADGLCAVWDLKSRGTKNMIEEAMARNLDIYIHPIRA